MLHYNLKQSVAYYFLAKQEEQREQDSKTCYKGIVKQREKGGGKSSPLLVDVLLYPGPLQKLQGFFQLSH